MGYEVTPRLKYQGMIYLETGQGYCGGVLILPNIMLTAGHCALNPIKGYKAYLLRHDITKSNDEEKGKCLM